MAFPTLDNLLRRSAYLTIGMLVVWIGLDAWLPGTVWAGLPLSQSALTVEYCEFNHVHRFVHQPSNTYSNLVYFFLGVLILQIAQIDEQKRGEAGLNRLEQFPLLSALMGGCFVYLGFGSAFFHASLTYLGQRVDMNATYSIMLTLVGIALYYLVHRLDLTAAQKKGWVLMIVLLIGAFFKLSLLVPSSRLVPGLILGINVLMLIDYIQFPKDRSLGLLLLGLGLIVVAIKIRTLDVQKVNCDPSAFFQGHAFWHVLTGLSSFCSYSFFRFTRITS